MDADFGPFFLKFCSYFPYTAKLCLNGHEWAKRQAAKAGIGFTALDNGFATCDDPAALQTICDRLGPERIDGLLRNGPDQLSPGQMSYDLRRLRHHGLIDRVPGTHRYRVSDTGLTHALFLTRVHDRVLRTGLA